MMLNNNVNKKGGQRERERELRTKIANGEVSAYVWDSTNSLVNTNKISYLITSI